MIDIRRRAFIFGAAATLIVPPPKKFFIIDGAQRLLTLPQRPKLFDLPLQQMLDLMNRLDAQEIEAKDIPRWVWISPQAYDAMIKS